MAEKSILQEKEQVFYLNSQQEIAKIISQRFPYSYVAVLCSEQNYFEWGIKIQNFLKTKNLKPIFIIDNMENNFDINKISNFFNLPEYLRAIIILDKKFLPMLSMFNRYEEIFFLIFNHDIDGMFLRDYYIKDDMKFYKYSIDKKINYIFFLEHIEEEKNIKKKLLENLSIKASNLIDYINKENQKNEENLKVFYGAKKILCKILTLKDEKQDYIDKLLDYSIDLEYLCAKNSKLYYFSFLSNNLYLANKNFSSLNQEDMKINEQEKEEIKNLNKILSAIMKKIKKIK